MPLRRCGIDELDPGAGPGWSTINRGTGRWLYEVR